MNAFLAIVLDTWRQSKQQVVFLLMILLLLFLAALVVFLPAVYPRATRVLLNPTGAGQFNAAGELRFEATHAVALGDLDGDGDLDVVSGNGGETPDRVWLNDGRGGFSASEQALGNGDTRAVALGDLDGDEDIDLITGAAAGGDQVWLNDGKGTFKAGPVLGDGDTRALALGDLDGDKDLDLVVGRAAGPNRVWLNDGRGSFQDSGQALGTASTRAIALGDLDDDGDLDLVSGNAGGALNTVWLNDGRGRLSLGGTAGRGDTHALALGDLNGDRKLDVFCGNLSGQAGEMWLNQGRGSFASADPFGFRGGGRSIQAVALADVNGDGRPDLVCGTSAGEENTVRLNQSVTLPQNAGAARARQPRFYGTGASLFGASEVRALAVGDLDGDGKPDVLAVYPQQDLGFAWSDEPSDFLAQEWIRLYAQTVLQTSYRKRTQNQSGPERRAETLNELQRQAQATSEAMKQAQQVPGFQRSVEALVNWAARIAFTLSMVMFIVACSAYYPHLLADGAIDVVLSRPISRLRILLAKYAGGLLLYAAAILAMYLVIFLGIGLRTGVWPARLFLAAPLQIFSAAVLYAILACVGILFRSTILAVLLGLFLYVVIDSIFGFVLKVQGMGLLESYPRVEAVVEGARMGLPNFGLLKDVATMSVLHIPTFEWAPLVVAAVWGAIALGLGYWSS